MSVTAYPNGEVLDAITNMVIFDSTRLLNLMPGRCRRRYPRYSMSAGEFDECGVLPRSHADCGRTISRRT